MTPDSLCSAGEGRKRYRLIVRVKEPVQLCAACMHALGECGFGQPLILHECIKLAHDDAFDGSRRCLGIKTLILQKFVERRPDATFFSCDLLPAGHRSIRIHYAASTDSRPARSLAPRGDDAASRRNQQKRLHHGGEIVEAVHDHREPGRLIAVAQVAEQQAD
jgi:hypothetical protein